MIFKGQFKKNFIFFRIRGYLFYDLGIYVQNVCLLGLTNYFIIMKNLLGSFKTREFRVNGVEFLNANEMQKVRGGAEPVKPPSRPKEFLDWE